VIKNYKLECSSFKDALFIKELLDFCTGSVSMKKPIASDNHRFLDY